MKKIPEDEKSLRRAAELEKSMQCTTMIHIMADYDEETRRKAYQKFMLKHLIPYLFSQHFSIRKKIGAVAVLVCPKKFLRKEKSK